jgi:hypothetical protein
MSKGLSDLLDYMRQHPCFPELLKSIEPPALLPFKRSQAGETEAQTSDWIYRSGQRAMHDAWRSVLIGSDPQGSSHISQQEKS